MHTISVRDQNRQLRDLTNQEAMEHVELALWECGLEPDTDTSIFSDGDIDVMFQVRDFELVIFKGTHSTTLPLILDIETSEQDPDGWHYQITNILLSRSNIQAIIETYRKLLGGMQC